MTLLSADTVEGMIRASGGKPVVFGSESSWGHENREGVEMLSLASAYGVELVVSVVATKISATPGEALTFDGSSYEVRERQPFDDGMQVDLFLVEA